MAARKSYSARPSRTAERAGLAESEPHGQALFEMANLRPERTGLPFVVFISQRGGARHDVRVKVAPGPKVRASEMATVAVRPAVRVIRGTLNPSDLDLLTAWIDLNRGVLVDCRNGDIEYAKDAIGALMALP